MKWMDSDTPALACYRQYGVLVGVGPVMVAVVDIWLPVVVMGVLETVE